MWFVDLVTFLIVGIASTGWFLFPEHFAYVIYGLIVINSIALLYGIFKKHMGMAFFNMIDLVFHFFALNYNWLWVGYTILGILFLGVYCITSNTSNTDEKDNQSKEISVPYNHEVQEQEHIVVEKNESELAVEENDLNDIERKVIKDAIVTKGTDKDNHMFYIIRNACTLNNRQDQIKFFESASEALKWVCEQDPDSNAEVQIHYDID